MLKLLLRSTARVWLACSILLVPLSAGADFHSREVRSVRNGLVARISRVDVDAGRLFIVGQNLPDGYDVSVLLGGQSLPVLRASRGLVVAELPLTRPRNMDELVVEGGVRRAFVRGKALEWSIRWDPPSRESPRVRESSPAEAKTIFLPDTGPPESPASEPITDIPE